MNININTVITGEELREFRGEVYIPETKENLANLENIERKHWKELQKNEQVEERKAKAAETEAKEAGRKEEATEHKKRAADHHQKALLFDAIVRVVEMKADLVRVKLGLRPKWQRVNAILAEEIGNNELTRLERFKQWAKKNFGDLSLVSISVASIITTIVMGTKSVIVKGAKAASSFAKGLASLAKKLGPVLGALLNIVAQGLAFLSKNLWILAIAIAYFLYDQFKNRKKRN